MGFMQRFERKLQDAVGNTFARVFGGKIVPAEVEDALQREASHGLQNLSGHALAPNHYVLTVSDSDEENLTSDTELTLGAFAKHLTGYINEQGWETYGAVSVELESSPELHTGQFRARSVITPDDDSAAPVASPSLRPHPQPGAAQMPQESSPAPRPRYQQPEPWQPQPPAQAYSQRPPAGQVPPYQGHQYQGAQYQGQQPHGGHGQTPPRPDQAYGQQQQQYRAPRQQSADRQPEYPAAQYSQPEPPVQAYSEGPAQAYSERPHPGQSSPQQQRYSSERYADPRFQPPAHLYPPQQPTEGPPPPPQQPPPQQPGPSVPHGYQDQAYADQSYPLQDPSAAGGDYADPHYSTQGGTPQQRPWTADGPGVSLELGDGSGRNLELRRGSNILGRGQDADFRIPDTGVSRQHADIQWDGAVALVVDLQSTNGTVVNNIPISEWQLADGDVIRMGHSDITVRFH